MKKGIKRCLSGALAVSMFLLLSLPAAAYFDRGTMSVSLGQSSLSVTQGATGSVSVAVSPASDMQLPGCGMAECPQSCGEKDCLDENGQCTCAGTTYVEYKTSITTSSSNAGVAEASYTKAGVLVVFGKNPGTATITVTASMRQFKASSATLVVTVTEKKSGAGDENQNNTNNSVNKDTGNSVSENKSATGGSNKSTSGNKKNSSGSKSSGTVSGGNEDGGEAGINSATVQSSGNVNGDDKTSDSSSSQKSSDDKESSSKSESSSEDEYDSVTTVESDKGPITFVPIVEDEQMGKKWMESIQGKTAYVVFEYKDEAGNVIYSWQFSGETLSESADIDMSIFMASDGGESIKAAAGGKSGLLYLTFAHEGALPGPAEITLRISDYITDTETASLYYYNEKTGKTERIAEDLTVENGYVTFTLEHCSEYYLEGSGGGGSYAALAVNIVIIVIAVVIAVMIVHILVMRRRMIRKDPKTENPDGDMAE